MDSPTLGMSNLLCIYVSDELASHLDENEGYRLESPTYLMEFDVDIDNFFDLEPNGPTAFHDFISTIKVSGPVSSHENMTGLLEEEYGAVDEDNEANREINQASQMECLSIEIVDYEDSPTNYDDDRKTVSLNDIPEMDSRWTLDSQSEQLDSHPVHFLRQTIMGSISRLSHYSQSSVASLLSPRENSTPAYQVSNSDPESSEDLAQTSYLPGAEHFPKAATFFTVDNATGLFISQFEASPSHSTQGSQATSPPSSLTPPHDFEPYEGLDSIELTSQISTAFGVSSHTRFGNISTPGSLHLENSWWDERGASGVFGRFLSYWSLSSSSATQIVTRSAFGAELPSAKDIDRHLSDLIFENAAHDFFSAIDVEGLLADQYSGTYTFEDHDFLHEEEDLILSFPAQNWQPHLTLYPCCCCECSENSRLQDEAREHYEPHMFNPGCSCVVCHCTQSDNTRKSKRPLPSSPFSSVKRTLRQPWTV
jgi:hypothetical protein